MKEGMDYWYMKEGMDYWYMKEGMDYWYIHEGLTIIVMNGDETAHADNLLTFSILLSTQKYTFWQKARSGWYILFTFQYFWWKQSNHIWNRWLIM